MAEDSLPAAPPNAAPPAERRRAGLRRFVKWALMLIGFVVAVPALYFGAAEIAMRITVEGETEPLDGSIDVYFFASGPHVDVWVPSVHPEFPWRDRFPQDFPLSRTGYLAIGWGDRDFYTKVPTWADLSPGIAVR